MRTRTKKSQALKTVKRLKRPAPMFAVLTRHITTGRGHKAVWGSFKPWLNHKDMVLNIKEAIRYAKKKLREAHIGTIVYIAKKGTQSALPVWEAKWGHDNLPFISWKANPAADYWRRRLSGE